MDAAGWPAVDGAEAPGTDRPTLVTSAFEIVRLRLGRRTREQVAALDWTGDPEQILDDLFVFGPAQHPLVE